MLEPAGGPENVRRVAEGGADVCLTSVNHYINARREYGDLAARFIAVVSQRHPVAGLVRADSAAVVTADLAGLRLGGSSDNSLTRELIAGLRHLGIEPPAVVEVTYAEAPASLGRGEVDVIADFADLVPRTRRQAGVAVRAIPAGAPVYATGLVAADRLTDDAVGQLRSALIEVLEVHRADPAASLVELARRYPGVDPEEALEGWSYAAESIFTGAPVGDMTAEKWSTTLEHSSNVHGGIAPPAHTVYRKNFLTVNAVAQPTGACP